MRPEGLRLPGPVLILVLLTGCANDEPDAKSIDLVPALTALQQGNTATARTLLDDALELQPENAKALLYRSQIAQSEGDYQLALQLLGRIPPSNTADSGTARYLEGTAWYGLLQARRSENAFLLAIKHHPGFIRPYESLSLLYSLQLRREDLQSILTRIRSRRSWTIEELVAYQLGDSRYNQPAANIPLLEALIAADPDDLDSRLSLTRHLLNAERTGDAARLLEESLAKWPDELRIRALLVDMRLMTGDLDGAQQLLAAPPPPGPVHPWWWRSHADFSYERKDWTRAARCYVPVLANDPNDFTSAYRLGIALQRIGDADGASRQLHQAHRLEQLSVQASNILRGNPERTDLMAQFVLQAGRLLLELDRPREAIPWFEFVVAHQPVNIDARNLLQLAASRAEHQPLPSSHSTDLVIPDLVAAEPPSGSDSPAVRLSTPAASGDRGIRLVDEAAAAGLSFMYFNGHSREKYLLDTVGGGVAVLDFDADGDPDLFFPNGCRIPFDADSIEFRDQLYRNLNGAAYEQITDAVGVGANQFGQGCATADFDNDGFVDLFVANYGTLLAYHNNGDGTYSESSSSLGFSGVSWKSSLAWGDFDGDGNLDLYTVSYVLDPLLTCRDAEGRPSTCSPGNFPADVDELHQNDGRGGFMDISRSAGITVPDGKGLGIVVADFDNDRRPDIYVANDGTPNFLFQNDSDPDRGIHFVELGMVSGTAVSEDGRAQAGMGIACADFDHNSWMDLFVTNFYQDTNTFYSNHGGLLFQDDTRSLNLAAPSYAVLGFGTQPVDLDLDGFAEIFVANGHIDDRRFEDVPWQMRPQLFRRTEHGPFAEISDAAGDYFGGEYIGRGVAKLDWDGDALPDLVVVHQDRPVALLTNRCATPGHRLTLTLIGREANRSAVGASIEIHTELGTYYDQLTGGDGFFVTNQPSRTFGLAEAPSVEQLVIHWPGGQTTSLSGLKADAHWLIQEGRPPLPLR